MYKTQSRICTTKYYTLMFSSFDSCHHIPILDGKIDVVINQIIVYRLRQCIRIRVMDDVLLLTALSYNYNKLLVIHAIYHQNVAIYTDCMMILQYNIISTYIKIVEKYL